MSFDKQDNVSNGTTQTIGSGMKSNDGFYGTGFVEVRPFRFVDGNRIFTEKEFSKHNLIVERGRETLIDLMIGETNKKLKFIRWGKGGAGKFPEGDPLNPYEVEDSNTDVIDEVLDKRLNSHRRVGPTEIEYTETLISDEVNDDINEAAIMFEDEDTLEKSIFARITFPTIRLTVEKGTGIELVWTFNFNKAEEVTP